MIGFIRGRLVGKMPPKLVIDVGGVGYEIDAPMSTFFQLPDAGAELTVLTHLVVREDQHTLYGFMSDAERVLFRELLKVNGVGAKMALAILSALSVDDFALCVQDDDKTTLCRVPGVGRKTAERLIIDMRDRIEPLFGAIAGSAAGIDAPAEGVGGDTGGEAYHALISLGYKATEARKMIKAVPDELTSTEDILQAALSSVAPERRA